MIYCQALHETNHMPAVLLHAHLQGDHGMLVHSIEACSEGQLGLAHLLRGAVEEEVFLLVQLPEVGLQELSHLGVSIPVGESQLDLNLQEEMLTSV